MASKTRLLNNTSFLTEGQSRQADSAAFRFGAKYCGEWMKVLRVAALFPLEHPQVSLAASGMIHALDEAFDEYQEEQFALQVTERNVFLNGDLIRFDESQHSRGVFLRGVFSSISINIITCKQGIGSGEVLMFLKAYKDAKEEKRVGLGQFNQPHLIFELSKEDEHEDTVRLDEKRAIVEMYAGLLIKCAVYFHQLKRVVSPSAKHIKRLIQKITDQFDEHHNIFIGLIQLKVVKDQPFIHAINTALYAMLIAHQVGLGRTDIVRVGMSAITQDIHRFRNPMADEEQIELGEVSHFNTNMTSVTMLSEMGSQDVLSALRLVTSYERGFPYSQPLPRDWYMHEVSPHLLSRTIELANHYDMLNTGIGTDKQSADMALQTLMNNMGSFYDPELTKLFINVVGVFPVGSVVLLSTGEQALVIRSPNLVENKSVANRPTVRLLDGSERLLDLSVDEHRAIRIVQILDDDQVEEQPSAVFLF